MYRYVIEKHQTCWTCQAEYKVAHSSQFTDIQVESREYWGRWPLLALLKAMIGARLERRNIRRIHAKQRALKGWR